MGPPTSGHPTNLILSPAQDGLQIGPGEACRSDSRGQCGFDSHERGQTEADAMRGNT